MEVREIIYGFEVKEKKYVREVEGNIFQLEHQKTGAEQLRGDVSGSQKEYGFKSVAFWDEDKQRKRLARKL